jgi:hypothetical protein
MRAINRYRNDSTRRPLLCLACETRDRSTSPWDADYCFGFSAFRCRLFFWFGCSAVCTANLILRVRRSISLKRQVRPLEGRQRKDCYV